VCLLYSPVLGEIRKGDINADRTGRMVACMNSEESDRSPAVFRKLFETRTWLRGKDLAPMYVNRHVSDNADYYTHLDAVICTDLVAEIVTDLSAGVSDTSVLERLTPFAWENKGW